MSNCTRRRRGQLTAQTPPSHFTHVSTEVIGLHTWNFSVKASCKLAFRRTRNSFYCVCVILQYARVCVAPQSRGRQQSSVWIKGVDLITWTGPGETSECVLIFQGQRCLTPLAKYDVNQVSWMKLIRFSYLKKTCKMIRSLYDPVNQTVPLKKQLKVSALGTLNT